MEEIMREGVDEMEEVKGEGEGRRSRWRRSRGKKTGEAEQVEERE